MRFITYCFTLLVITLIGCGPSPYMMVKHNEQASPDIMDTFWNDHISVLPLTFQQLQGVDLDAAQEGFMKRLSHHARKNNLLLSQENDSLFATKELQDAYLNKVMNKMILNKEDSTFTQLLQRKGKGMFFLIPTLGPKLEGLDARVVGTLNVAVQNKSLVVFEMHVWDNLTQSIVMKREMHVGYLDAGVVTSTGISKRHRQTSQLTSKVVDELVRLRKKHFEEIKEKEREAKKGFWRRSSKHTEGPFGI